MALPLTVSKLLWQQAHETPSSQSFLMLDCGNGYPSPGPQARNWPMLSDSTSCPSRPAPICLGILNDTCGHFVALEAYVYVRPVGHNSIAHCRRDTHTPHWAPTGFDQPSASQFAWKCCGHQVIGATKAGACLVCCARSVPISVCVPWVCRR